MGFSDLPGEGFTVTTGQKKLTNFDADRRVVQYINRLDYLNAGIAPCYSLLEKLGQKKVVKNEKAIWFQDDKLPGQVELAASAADSATEMTVATNHYKRLKAGDVLLVGRSGELIRVGSTPTTTTVTIERGQGGTTAQALVDDDVLHHQGSAPQEGAQATTGRSNEAADVSGAVQTFREPFEMSRRAMKAEVYGGNDWERLMDKTNVAIREKIERAFMFNPGISTTDETITGGLPYYLSTNVTNLGSTVLDEVSMNTFIKKLYRYNTDNQSLICFAGENILDALDAIGREQLQYSVDDNMLGFSVAKYKNFHGDLTFKKHGMLSDILGSDPTYGAGWGGYMFCVNMNYAGVLQFADDSLHLRKNLEYDGQDGSKYEWMADIGLWVAVERRHGYMYGAASVDDA